MSKKQKIFLLISLLIALADGVFVLGNFLLSRAELEDELSRQARSFSSAFQGAQRTAEDSLRLIASIFANDVQVQRLFAAGKAAVEAEGGGAGGERAARARAALLDIVAPRWGNGARQLGARQLHFHLAPGSLSFLRVHRPERFGDRMDDLRFTIVDTNAEGTPRSGFETGRVYSGIRGVVPVRVKDEATGQEVQIGSVEAGMSYDRLVDGFRESTGSDLTVLLTKAHVESAMWPERIAERFEHVTPCGCVIEASSSPLPLQIVEQAARTVDGELAKTGQAQVIDAGDAQLVAAFFPLRDYLGQREPSRADVGAVVIWRDITERMAAFERGQWFNLGYGLLAYLFVELLLLLGFKRVTRTLETQVANAVSAKGESEARLRTLINATPDIICFKDGQGRWQEANDADLALFSLEAVDYRGKTDVELAEHAHPIHREAFLACTDSDEAAWRAGSVSRSEELIPMPDGEVKTYDVIKAPLYEGDGSRKALIVLGRDHTERKEAEQLAALRARLSDLVYRGDLDTLIQEALDTAEDLTGSRIGFFHFVEKDQENLTMQTWSRRTLEGSCVVDQKRLHYPLAEAGVWADCVRRRAPVILNDYPSLDHGNGLPDGHAPLARMVTVPVFRDGVIAAVIGVGNKERDYVERDADRIRAVADMACDFIERKRAEEQVAYMAYYDTLTGLPNRALLFDRLNQAMAQHLRSDQLLAVCYLDLDGFKPVNDQYGHELGDTLLVDLANRLREALRDGDTVARLGGDEFVVLLTSLEDARQSESVVQRLLECIALPFEIAGRHIQISGSFGITLYPSDDAVADGLLRHADQAMYQAKAASKVGYRFYDTVLDQQQRERLELRAQIEAAIRGDELVLYYQPRVDLADGKVVGVEALVRWQHPERGLLAPAQFLPVIEGSAQEIQLGRWVVRQALAQHTAWQEQGLSLPVSVNISPNHIQSPGFSESIAAALAEFPKGTADNVELEVLETAAIGDIAHVAAVMDACIALGLRFSLDDFGTGYSSLTYFQRLPIEVLKVDQQFVRGMLEQVSDLNIVQGVLRLAEALKRPVVAEGVESIELGLLLLNLGCRYAQGFGIARPMAPEQLEQWLAEWERGGLWLRLAEVDLGAGRDLELRVAVFSHRRWLDQIRACIRGEATCSPPPSDREQCQLGRWYQGIGRSRYGASPTYGRIPEKHARMHDLAESILGERESGDPEAARARLPELDAASAELIELLRSLADR